MSDKTQTNENQKMNGSELLPPFCSQLILLDYEVEDSWIRKTNHPLVTFDTSVETWNVDCGDGTWAEFWGVFRSSRALEYANFILANQKFKNGAHDE